MRPRKPAAINLSNLNPSCYALKYMVKPADAKNAAFSFNNAVLSHPKFMGPERLV